MELTDFKEDRVYEYAPHKEMFSHIVYPDTVGRCTGVHERTPSESKGKLIFDGDKVRVYGGECYQGVWEHDKTIVVDITDWEVLYALSEIDYVEIISNIHDKEGE